MDPTRANMSVLFLPDIARLTYSVWNWGAGGVICADDFGFNATESFLLESPTLGLRSPWVVLYSGKNGTVSAGGLALSVAQRVYFLDLESGQVTESFKTAIQVSNSIGVIDAGGQVIGSSLSRSFIKYIALSLSRLIQVSVSAFFGRLSEAALRELRRPAADSHGRRAVAIHEHRQEAQPLYVIVSYFPSL